jgi:hypothetical protein
VPHTYSYEQYSDCLESGEVDAVYIALPNHMHHKEPAPSGQEGLADVRVIRAILEAAEIGRPVSLPQVKIDRRPNLGQEISKEAVAKAPELVRAAAPGAKKKVSKAYNCSKENNDGEVWESLGQDSQKRDAPKKARDVASGQRQERRTREGSKAGYRDRSLRSP